MHWNISAFYKFSSFPDYKEFKQKILEWGEEYGICGSILVASEGMNGTIAGQGEKLNNFLKLLRTIPGFETLEDKQSYSEEEPFYRFKVRLKKEIVTLGVPVDPINNVGQYVDPQDWNELINNPKVKVVDTRNLYEIDIGKFKGAINPCTDSFREFPDWVDENLDPQEDKEVAMYCTGGIRCEKATALLKERGFKKVYHLKGGILKYLENVDSDESLWEGSCFVFDNRVGVEHGLEPSNMKFCGSCRHPITEEDSQHPDYEEGVSCHRCITQQTEEKKARLRERQFQIELARKRGLKHFGKQSKIKSSCQI